VRPLGERLVGLTDRAWERFEAAWGGEAHRRNISRRDRSEPELYDPAEMMADGPFDDPVWTELETVLAELAVAFPDELTGWVALGRAVARVLDPREEGRPGLAHVPAVVIQLSAVRGGVLDALPSPLASRTRDEVLRLHELLLERLAGAGSAAGDNAESAEGGADMVPGTPAQPIAESEKEVLAIHFLMSDPGRSQEEIAQFVGCNRGSLYRMQIYQAARKIVARQTRRRIRRGQVHRLKDGSAMIDGVEEHDPADDVKD
jgi:hypothetical protein